MREQQASADPQSAMSPDGPLISLGLPVFNGENYVAEAIESVLGQSYTKFELIIVDNASDDRTLEICEKYAARDPRIKIIRNSRNMGAIYSFNKTFTLSRGTYFKWVAHDDVICPAFLEKCVSILEADPAATMCFTKVRIMDAKGDFISNFDNLMEGGDSQKPHERFKAVIRQDHWCYDIFGLIRANALKNTDLFETFVGSDRMLRAELALQGSFLEIPEYLFHSRDHSERSVRAMPSHHQRVAWFDPDKKQRFTLPHWRFFGEYCRIVSISGLSGREKYSCYLAIFSWLGINKNWARMIADLFIAVWPSSWQFFYKMGAVEEFEQQILSS